jgi:hypothetical protein
VRPPAAPRPQTRRRSPERRAPRRQHGGGRWWADVGQRNRSAGRRRRDTGRSPARAAAPHPRPVGAILIVTFLTAYVPFLGAILAGAFAVLIALGSGVTQH